MRDAFPPCPAMFIYPPQAGQVTACQGGEPHVIPLDKCPKCNKPIGYLSVNNGFTTLADKGKLQQSVCNDFLQTTRLRVLTYHLSVYPMSCFYFLH